ncbi:MAG: hypothetical protein GX580_02770 [Candidatus Hydrogenedens sp.]|nr:hypothetical protein [Candidatus Hydrogenedens sp.]
MKELLKKLIPAVILWALNRWLGAAAQTPAANPKTEPTPHEKDIRAMDAALADGDAGAVAALFDRLRDNAPPPCGTGAHAGPGPGPGQ